MINRHIVNIGFPRSGTTWLWNHSGFEPRGDKENDILTTSLDLDHYVDYYRQYSISANFQPSLWCVDQEIIRFIQSHATHITVIVRNPYDFIERFFDWIHRKQDPTELTQYLVSDLFVKYKDIVDRWSNGAKNFRVFFFEDLEQNPVKFFQDYMDFCQIDVAKNHSTSYNTKINVNPKKQKIKLNFTAQQIEFINQEIDRFQTTVDRDLTHWKR